MSTKKSSPSYGFGTSSREVAKKVFVSQQHTILATAGLHSPGPASCTLPNSVGEKQPNSRKQDPPSWGFGTANRFRPMSAPANPAPGHHGRPQSAHGVQVDSKFKSQPLFGFGTATRKHTSKVFLSAEHNKIEDHGRASPGPATYILKAAIGPHLESQMASEPAWQFGGSARARADVGRESPGPVYVLPQSVGPQPDSRKPRAATPGFGAATREKQGKVFLGPDHEKAAHGRQSPGPAAQYQTASSLGQQLHSKDRQAPSSSFSKASRFASWEQEKKKNSVPGPGAY